MYAGTCPLLNTWFSVPQPSTETCNYSTASFAVGKSGVSIHGTHPVRFHWTVIFYLFTSLHYIHKKLTRVAHGMLERLATGGEFRWYGPYFPHGRGPWGPADHSPLRGQSGQSVGRRQARGSVRGSVAPFAECTRGVAVLGKGSVAVGEGRAAVLGRDVGMSVAVRWESMAPVAQLAGWTLNPPLTCSLAWIWFAAAAASWFAALVPRHRPLAPPSARIGTTASTSWKINRALYGYMENKQWCCKTINQLNVFYSSVFTWEQCSRLNSAQWQRKQMCGCGQQ